MGKTDTEVPTEELQDQEDDESQVDLSEEELLEIVKRLEEDKEGMQSQIIELRKRAREAEFASQHSDEDSDDESEEEDDDDDDPVERVVEKVLQRERAEKRKKNRTTALNRFWKSHPEYHPENDTNGLRMQNLEKTLNRRFNTSSSFEVEDIVQDLEDAHNYLSPEQSNREEVDISEYAPTSKTPSASNRVDDSKRLNTEQERHRKRKGWSVEKYLEMKSKYPDIIP